MIEYEANTECLDAEALLTDVDLIRQVAHHRDERAFEILYNRHEKRIHALACRSTGYWGAAEEVLQEAMLQMWRSASTFREGSVRRWISRIVINESRRMHNRSMQQARRDNKKSRSESVIFGEDLLDREQKREDLERLDTAVKRLPVADRILAANYFGRGLSQASIALEIGVSPRVISYRLQNILARLRKLMMPPQHL